jgi:hypothetical protein
MDCSEICKRLINDIKERLKDEKAKFDYNYRDTAGLCIVWFSKSKDIELAEQRNIDTTEAESFVVYDIKNNVFSEFHLRRVLPDNIDFITIDIDIPVVIHIDYEDKLLQINNIFKKNVPYNDMLDLIEYVYHIEDDYI